MNSISLDMIIAAKKLMDEAEVPMPRYVVLRNSVVTVDTSNLWLMWLFINDLMVTKND